MKKILAVLLAGVMALFMSACADGASANPNLLMITDRVTDDYSAYGTEIANTLNAMLSGINLTPSVTDDSAQNARLLNKKGADIAILSSGLLDYAYQGTGAFAEDGRLENIASIAALYPQATCIIAANDAQIGSVADLKGKRVSIGAAGSATQASALRLLEACGIRIEDLEAVEYFDDGDSIAALGQAAIDAFFMTANLEGPAISPPKDAHIVPVGAQEAQALIAQYPYYSKYTVPQDAFSGLEGFGGVETIASPATLVCRKDLDEETIYQVTKALFEHKNRIAHDQAKTLDPAASKGNLAVSLHPGASKYFAEAEAE